jgi:hypothetical protein
VVHIGLNHEIKGVLVVVDKKWQVAVIAARNGLLYGGGNSA